MNTPFLLQRLALPCLPLLGSLILATAPSTALAQNETTTTVTTQPVAPSATTVTTQPMQLAPVATTVTTQPVQVVPVTTMLQTTTVTTVAPTPLYISKRHSNGLRDGANLSTRPNGKVYNTGGDCIGHLTSMEGADITALPIRDEFKIRNSHGAIIASTRPSSSFDSDRKVMLSRKDGLEPVTSSTTTTTRKTTITP